VPTPTTVAGARRFGLRAHLVALVLAVLLPSLALGAATAWRMTGNYRLAFEERLSATAQALALDREVQAHVAALTALAASPRLDDPDLVAFHAHARGAAEALGTPVVVIGADLRQRLHTERPLGAPLPATGAPETARRAAESGRPAVSDLLVGAVLRTPVVAVMVPVARGGRVDAVLSAPLDPGRLSGLLASQGLAGEAFATLTDSRNVVVARSRDAAAFLGRPVPGWFPEATAGREAGVLKGRALAGHDVILAFRRLSSAPDWTVVVAEPLAAYEASWRRPLLALGIGGVSTLLVALLAAARLGRRVLRPVRALARQAEAVATSGGAAAPVPEGEAAPVAEFEGLRLSMRRAEAAIRARAAAAAGEARLRAVVDTAVDAIVVIDERGVVRSFNRGAEAIFGHAAADAVGRNVSMLMGDEHRSRHDGYLAAYLRTGERKIIGVGREVEGRRKDGSAVPLDLSIAEWRDGEGRRFFTGIMRDISARKADEARRTLLVREVDHRAKNALAVVQSVLRLTPKDDPRAFAAAVEARVAALARVHSLLAEGGWSGADLRAVAERELAPYAAAPRHGFGAAPREAVSLDGPPVPLAPAAVQPFAMVLHEMATNAAKHGALSVPGGRVEVRWRAGGRAGDDGMLRLFWTETGGPPVAGAPARRGFGTRVVEATVRGQLGGTVERRWERTGLVVEVAVPLARLVADVGGPAPGRRHPGQRSAGRAADAALDAPAGPLDRPLTLGGGERKGGSEQNQRLAGGGVHLLSSRRAGGRADACPAAPCDEQRTP
jgi:PAS domain S-box-containing protein